MSRSRAKKILQISVQNQQHQLDEPNNPDSALFINNQYPKPYDNLVGHDSIASNSVAYFDNNNYIDCLENNQPGVDNISSEILNNKIISDDQMCYNNMEIVDNVIIKNLIELETENHSPSLLLSRPTTPLNNETDGNTFEPTNEGLFSSNDQLFNDVLVISVPRELSILHETIPSVSPASTELMKKLVDYSDSDLETEEPLVKRKKRCQVKKDEWVSEINKKNREKGKEYCSKKKVDGEWKRNIRKPKRVMKPRCTCKEKKKSVIKCHSISEDDRKLLFDKFWDMTWKEKRVYIDSLVKVIHTNRPRGRTDPKKSKRANSFIYYLKKEEDMIRVCKTLFLNTFCIGKSCVWGWKSEIIGKNTDERLEESTTKNTFEQENKTLHEFLHELPKMPSHYCRKRTTQTYLQSDISSKRQLYEMYIDYCKSKIQKPLSIATFTNTLTIQKISLFKPKKDLCEICNGYKMGHITKETYEEHINKKNEARLEKDSDKEKEEFVFTADLQAVLLAPR